MPQETTLTELMCPHCGWRYDLRPDRGPSSVPPHADEQEAKLCPGSFQAPRNPETDLRPLWKDLPR